MEMIEQLGSAIASTKNSPEDLSKEHRIQRLEIEKLTGTNKKLKSGINAESIKAAGLRTMV